MRLSLSLAGSHCTRLSIAPSAGVPGYRLYLMHKLANERDDRSVNLDQAPGPARAGGARHPKHIAVRGSLAQSLT